jgi:hypothetical protein
MRSGAYSVDEDAAYDATDTYALEYFAACDRYPSWFQRFELVMHLPQWKNALLAPTIIARSGIRPWSATDGLVT